MKKQGIRTLAAALLAALLLGALPALAADGEDGAEESSTIDFLSYEEAVNKAQQYLSAHGYDSMKDTYYETDNGVMTLNFAYYDSASQTICYTDLIKVEVSLQDGSILGLDARGYLVNHHDRTIAEPALTVEQAQESLSDALTVDSVRPALIPSSGQNEVATYEFLCSSATGDRILVYINSQTGAEEQLLILLQTPNGTLTK